MSLITETNQQYYEGAQGFIGTGRTKSFTATFNTDLVWFTALSTDVNYALNNFKLYTSPNGNPGSFQEVTTDIYTVSGNELIFDASPLEGEFIVIQLKALDGGNYGTTLDQKAYGEIVENNYGSYSYLSLKDVVNNFLVAYVGAGKLILDVKRTDVVFHAKRAVQEFSYDTLKSVHSQELTIPPSLSVVIPQDYVNYVKVSCINSNGVKIPIYPTNNLTTIPYEKPIQDSKGVPTQDSFGANIEGTSITEERWKSSNTTTAENLINEALLSEFGWGYEQGYGYGQLYGMDPQYSNSNGWFTLDEREGKMSFSSNLAGKLIVFEYISDGLSTDLNTKIPKLAEDAMYAYISHAIIATRINQPEYIVQRLKREKSSKLRNAKIRLSNIKLDEITQVMRGKSKWIKH